MRNEVRDLIENNRRNDSLGYTGNIERRIDRLKEAKQK